MSNKLLLFVLASFLFWTCKKNDITDSYLSGPRVTTTITGIVTNEAGQFLQGVSVTVGRNTVLTDKEGLFLFEKIEVPELRYYVKSTLSNYFESGVGGIAVKNGVTTLHIRMMGMGTPKDVSATAASTNTIGGATLKFDAGSFANQNGTAVTSGTVRVYARALNPDNPNFSELLPGGDLSSRMPDGSSATLESYGMVGVELRDANNNELKLASGKQAEIRFPIASSQLATAPAEIPLLSMDPETGVWKQEGVAAKVGSEYVGKVGHFSWWNCDVPQQTCRIRGRVVDCNGKPVSGATVIVNGQFSMITNSNGYYERNAPRIRLTFQVKMFGANQNLTSSVTLNSPQPGLNIIPDIRLNTGSCPTYITGTLNRCNSTKTFYIRALWGQDNVEGWVPLEIKGDVFTISVPQNKQLIIRISSGTFTKDTVIGALTNGQVLNIGIITGCVTTPTLKTSPISNVNETSATSGGEIISNGGAPITARGIVWSTNPNPTISLSTKTSNGNGNGIFTSNITGLTNNTIYYVRAYATNSEGTGYGNEQTLKTSSAVQLPYVIIGTQIWSSKNLDVSSYRNGDPIPQVTDQNQWANLTTGAWCWYNNDSVKYAAIYGKLYNWYAVNDPRGLAPQGWHVPTFAEWAALITFLGGEYVAGGKMKSTGTQYWTSPNTDATNSSGWSGLPGGYRFRYNGSFSDIGNYGLWWSSTEKNADDAWHRTIYYDNGNVDRNGSAYSKAAGFSVRCIRD